MLKYHWRSSVSGRFIAAPKGLLAWVKRLIAVREERKYRDFKIGGSE